MYFNSNSISSSKLILSPYRKAHLRPRTLPENFPEVYKSIDENEYEGEEDEGEGEGESVLGGGVDDESMPKCSPMSLSIKIEDMTKLTDDEYLEMKSSAKSNDFDSESNATPSRM